MKTTPLVLQDIRKTYPGARAPAVNGLSLTLEAGEILTLLGPSGCGKTTTLRMIAGFERPDGGEIVVGGKRVFGPGTWVPPEARGVGMVFQDYALFPHLTIRENVAFGLGKVPAAERAERVRSALELVGLGGLGDRYPHSLSGGQQQRVALARALAPRPALVLLDEPFSNLDAALRVQMREEVRRILKNHGSAAVFVTHDQKDALAISDRIAVMNQGHLEQVGAPREIYQFPATEFTARFVGQTNVLHGELHPVRPDAVLTAIGILPCRHTHELPAGSPVLISIRPDSFEIDPRGPFQGYVRGVTYMGSTVEVEVVVKTDGDEYPLVIHAHPEESVEPGSVIRFRALPDFVAVIEEHRAAG